MMGGAASSSRMLWLVKRRLIDAFRVHLLSSCKISLDWNMLHRQLANLGHITASWLTNVKDPFLRMHHLLLSPHVSCALQKQLAGFKAFQ